MAPTRNVGASIVRLINSVRNHPWFQQETKLYVEKSLKSIIVEIKERYPDLLDGLVSNKKKDGCFIATATMDDVDHPTVEILRKYRDNVMRKSNWGRKFINNYYLKSPSVALIISRYPTLRFITRYFIVLPLSWAANIILIYSKHKNSQ